MTPRYHQNPRGTAPTRPGGGPPRRPPRPGTPSRGSRGLSAIKNISVRRREPLRCCLGKLCWSGSLRFYAWLLDRSRFKIGGFGDLTGRNVSISIENLKDALLLISPILIAYINYKANKKTKNDISLEIEKMLKEKDAETNQLLQRINAELESQKQLATWTSSLPQTDEYTRLAGVERYGNICALPQLISFINSFLDSNSLLEDDYKEMKSLLSRINLPMEEENLFPYEIPYILSYQNVIRRIDEALSNANNVE